LKREFTDAELMAGMKIVKTETGFVTKFNQLVIPTDDKEYQEAVDLVLAKNDALIERFKNIPKRSDVK
jgi:hypothetical protein